MLAHATTLLQHHSIPALLAARDSLARELAATQRQLAEVEQRIPAWERIAFFHDSADEALAGELRDRLAQVQGFHDAAVQQSDQALAALYAESPPIEVACRVARVISAARDDSSLGRRQGQEEPLAVELESIASRVADLWIPGFDGVQLASILAHDAARAHAASQVAGLLRGDPRLCWAPISPAELVARAAVTLQTVEFVQVRAVIAQEAAHRAAVAEQLRLAQEQVGTFDRIAPGESQSEMAVTALEGALAREQQEFVAATETFHHTLELALGAYPPMGIVLAALAAAGAIRTVQPGTEPLLRPSGQVQWLPERAPRAVILATLVELRASVDKAFPGLMPLVSASKLRVREFDAGPYREAAMGQSPVEPAAQSNSPDDVLLLTLERWNLRPLLVQGVAHASMLGGIARSRAGVRSQIGWSDRVAVWSDTPQEEVNAELEAREKWHGAMLRSVCNRATALVAQASGTSPSHALRAAVVAAHAAMPTLRTSDDRSSSPIACPEHGKAALVRALQSAKSTLQSGFGLRGDRQELVQAVLARLRGPALPSPLQPGMPRGVLGYEAIVIAVAESLRNTAFLEYQERLQVAQENYERAIQGAGKARAAVSFWDKLNFLTTSPEEQLRDDLDARTEELFPVVQAVGRDANGLLDQALLAYPPAVVYYALLPVISHTHAIRAERKQGTTSTRVGKTTVNRTYYYCELRGKDLAELSLGNWTARVVSCFGPIASPGELLERWVARELW